MSQVKKLQSGGTTPVTGKFRRNGREITGQLALDRLDSASSSLPIDEREMFTVAKKAIADGNTVEYFDDNTIQVRAASTGQDITDYYTDTKARTNNSWFKKTWGATFNDEAHRFKKSGEKMSLIDMTIPEEKPKETPQKTALRRGYEWWDYDKDAKGNLVYRENGPGNQDRMAILKGARTYFDDKDINTLKDRFSTEGWSSRELDSFRNMYNSLDDTAKNNFWTNLKSHIKSNQLTSAEEEVLNLFGFNRKGSKPEVEEVNIHGEGSGDDGGSVPTIHKDWKGNTDLAKKYGIDLDFKDGHWYVTGDNDFTNQNWYTGDLDWLAGTEFEDGFIINGRLYSANEVANKYNLSPKVQQILTPWFSVDRSKASWRELYDALNASKIRFVGDRVGKDSSYYGIFNETFDPNTHYDPTWYNYFSKLGNRSYDIADLSGAYGNLGNRKVLSYIDPTQVNTAGMYIPKFVVYDSSNTENPYLSYNNENDMISALGLTAPTGWTYSGSITQNPWSRVKNNDYALFQEFGNPGQRNTVWIDRNGKYYLGRKDPSGNPIKPIPITNKYFVQNLISNPNKYNNYNYGELEKLIRDVSELTPDYMDAQYPSVKKEGGKIEKLGFGRALQSTTTTAQSKDISEANTDITKSHALDGSDGGPTSGEKLQIAGAVGDLIGLGISFVPIAGNIAGAATGIGASTTKFIGDIKRDGYQKEDLYSYLGNLVLDTASLLPVLGKGAKAAKAAKIIKSAATPIIKALSAAGAATPVITAVTRIANGEKYTYADLAQAIQGVSSLAISGKMLKDSIGNAKLAKKVATKAADATNSGLNAAKSAEAGGFKMERTPDQLQAFVAFNPTKNKAIETVQAFAKHEGKEITTSDAEKILTDLGINFNKGKANFSLKAWKKGFHTRGEATTSFDRPEPAETGSTFGYLINPFKRSKVLGSEAVFGFGKNPGQMGLIEKSEISSALGRLWVGRASLTDQALARMTAYNPQAFGNLFGTKDNYNPSTLREGFYFGGNRYYRRFNYPSSVEPTSTPTPWPTPSPVPTPSSAVTPTSSKVPLTEIDDFTSRFNISFKRGGKIQKAQGGFNTSSIPGMWNSTPLWTLPQQRSSFVPLMNNSQPASQVKVSAPISVKTNNSVKTDSTSKTTNSANTTTNTKPKGFDINSKQNNGRRGGVWGTEVKVNKPNLNDLLRAGISARAIYKDRDIQREALTELKKRQFITPQLDRARYNFSDIEQGFNTQYDNLLNNKFVTSSARDAMAFNLAKSQQLSDVIGQKNAAKTQRINQIDEQNRQVDATNAINRANTANEKSSYFTQLEQQDKMLDSLALNRLFSEVINPVGYQFSQQDRDAYNQNADLKFNQAVDKAREDRTTAINALSDIVALKNEYNSDDTGKNISFEDWLELDASRIKRYTDAINNSNVNSTYNNAIAAAQALRSKQYGSSILYAKKGGSTRRERTPIEQMAINADLQAKKSTAKLSDNLMRMLQQLLKN